MIKKFLAGLAFGTGFGVAVILVAIVAFQVFLTSRTEDELFPAGAVVETPPPIKAGYLGSSSRYTGGSIHNRKATLTGGPGTIVGKAVVNDTPVSGLALRLALNGSVMSEWATTNPQGEYVINVPFGEYRIDGFDLDLGTANAVLDGKIDDPQGFRPTETFQVKSDASAPGLILKFVDPIEKRIEKRKFSVSEDIVLNWAPYPGASEYSVQVYEKSDPRAFAGNSPLLDWLHLPHVSSPAFSLTEHGIEPKVGHYYTLEVRAHNDVMRIISQTARDSLGYDFEVVK
jgi:hypothetical protein